MSYEHAPWKSKGKFTGIVQAGFPVGLLLANLVFLFSVHLGGDWAWRVPFLASIVLVMVGLVIRSKVPESPVFEDVKNEGDIVKSPVLESIKYDWRNILRGIGLRVAETAGYAVSITYMISYLHNQGLAGKSETLVALCIASAIGIFATVAWARLTDRIGRRPLYIASCAFAALFGIPMFLLVNTGLFILVIATIVIAYAVCQNSMAGAQGAWFPRTLRRLTPRLGSVPRLSDLGDGLRLHALRHHIAVRLLRLVGAGAAVQHVRPDRTVGGVDHQGDLGDPPNGASPPRLRRAPIPKASTRRRPPAPRPRSARKRNSCDHHNRHHRGRRHDQ